MIESSPSVVSGRSEHLTAHIAECLRKDDVRIILTGAGGWIGLATLELLRNALAGDFAERIVCYGSSARTLTLRGGTTVDQRPLAEIGMLDARPSIVLHTAFLTKDRVGSMTDEVYAAANRAVSATVLEALDAIGTTAVFVASSGAARHAEDEAAAHDLRLYGALKRRDEDAFAGWAAERGKTAVVTRIFNIAGPYINKHQTYALASFIGDALAARPIDVRASHRVVRGYVAIRELMSLIFALLLAAPPRIIRFDTGGREQELAEVAQGVAAALGSGTVRRAAITSDHVDDYVGDDAHYRALLDQFEIEQVSFQAQVRTTAAFMVAPA